MPLPVREPHLKDVLNDPIVKILMARDAVAEPILLEIIRQARGRMAPSAEELLSETGALAAE